MSEKAKRQRKPRASSRAKPKKTSAKATKNSAEVAGVTADAVIAELKRIAFSNVSKFISVNAQGQAEVNLSKMTFEDAAVIREIRVEDIDSGRRTGRRTIFKLHDKISALNLLGKHLGMFTNLSKVEHNVSVAEVEDVSRRLEDKLISLVASRYSQGAPRRLQ